MGKPTWMGAGRFAIACLLLGASLTWAEEKLIVLDDIPRPFSRFKVAGDGSKLYFAGSKYYVFDAKGKLIDQIRTPEGSSPRDLIPLASGWFIACTSYQGGHLALCRPDGTEAKTLVGKGSDEKVLRSDMTGWTSPAGAAIDAKRKRIFVLDTTAAPSGKPDPNWSRIAIYDFDGKYHGDINRYDDEAGNKEDARRTWYDDIAVDAGRQRVYVTARRFQELLAFGYDGKLIAKVKAPGSGGLAVFADGRIARGTGSDIQIYSSDFKPTRKLTLPEEVSRSHEGIKDVETDAAGRLYACVGDPSVTFVRWSADLKKVEVVGPPFRRLQVDFPDSALVAGKAFPLKVKVTGRPAPTRLDDWHVMARPSDGTDLRWQSLPAAYKDGTLTVTPPEGLRGLHDVVVRLGKGPIAWAGRARDPYVQKTYAFVAAGVTDSIAVITSSGRRAFRQGETIPLQLVRRDSRQSTADAELSLEQRGKVIARTQLRARRNTALAIPGSVTGRLAPGKYLLRPASKGHESYALAVDIASAQRDSPMQRILYHEFDNEAATMQQSGLADTAEKMAFIRDYARTAAGLGFTRETDRLAGKLDRKTGPIGWRRDNLPANVARPGFAPADYYAIPSWGSNWEAEFYLDRAVRRGLDYDSQLLEHCSGVRFRASWLRQFDPILQRSAQWLGRYPSFYGFNYNDEMFFGGDASDWTKEDEAWLKKVETGKLKGKPHAATLLYALRTMYDDFNGAVRQVQPTARVTATPMWQFPAADGSYAPAIYQGMSETYSHFISEGYALPWYPAHSVDFLRRPDLPLMGVFDNGYSGNGGDVYLKNVMQVMARGVQGTGVEHTRPFEDALGADAYRTANLLAKLYGPIFAEAPPANEAAVLYSYTQDITEKRNNMGTPHWERVYTLFGAGLMAGVPMSIVYEEDIAAGWLLDRKKPRVPMLFLAGQTKPLPAALQKKIAQFMAAGGKVFTDADSAPYPRATKLTFKTHELKALFHEGYASDTVFPLFQPVFEKLAANLNKAVGQHRRYPLDTDDPWVSKNGFDGGAVRYLMLASETCPYPWDAGTVWSLGAMYNRSYLPKTVAFSFPAPKGVVYDVFEHTLVKPDVKGKTARLQVDLTTFPGRLYALAPAPLGAPHVAAGVRERTLHYRIHLVDDDGNKLAARVPLRIRLVSGATVALEIVRGTDTNGFLAASIPLPVNAKEWKLEVTELLGGKGSVAVVAKNNPLEELVVKRPDVEPQREAQIRSLLKEAQGTMTLVMANAKVLSKSQADGLKAALKKQGIALKIRQDTPAEPTPGVYLAVGHMQGFQSQGDLLWQAWMRGLYDFPVSETVPGPGRGFFTALFAPRGYKEHGIALVGGDADGLGRTVRAFTAWLNRPRAVVRAAAPPEVRYTIKGKPAQVAGLPALSEKVGVKLSGVTVAANGKHLLVAADGYAHNLALIEDQEEQGKILRTARVGQAPTVGSPYISDDGKWFGASARSVARFGQGFHLLGTKDGKQEIFAGFGDMGRQTHHFAVSRKGNFVIAPGTYGAVCWHRDGTEWKEAWAIDFWKKFATLDWPVSATAERIPQFHAFIPHGADYALILYGEYSNNAWITPENPCEAWLVAVNLADGKRRWRFKVPILKTLLLPTLHSSPDGSRVLLQVQMGSWNKETYRFFSIAEGKAVARWDAKTVPLSVAVADAGGRVAAAYKGRLLEVRQADGKLLYNMLYSDQPVSLAFAADGRSLYVADDAGRLTRLDEEGKEMWQASVSCVSRLAASGKRVYAAGWDGRVRSFTPEGKLRWTLNCNSEMNQASPLDLVVKAAKLAPEIVHEAQREPTTQTTVPKGENLLGSGKATLTVGGTSGWMSQGKVQITGAELINGKTADVNKPWLHLNELFWDSQGGRQVWAEITFKKPTDVKALTVHENPKFPDSWPSEGLVQVWEEKTKSWKTAGRGVFLTGPVNTYPLHLKKVTKLRYLPWNSYYRNFYTSEIEVR